MYRIVFWCAIGLKKTNERWSKLVRITVSQDLSEQLPLLVQSPWRHYAAVVGKLLVQPNLPMPKSFAPNLEKNGGTDLICARMLCLLVLSPGDCGRFLFTWRPIISFVEPFLLALLRAFAWTISLGFCECKEMTDEAGCPAQLPSLYKIIATRITQMADNRRSDSDYLFSHEHVH